VLRDHAAVPAGGGRVNKDSFDSFGDELFLVVPPYSRYLRAVRLVAADTAARAGLDCEETEDFRLAVDELCHTLMSATDHPLLLTFVHTPTGVVARGVGWGRNGARPEISELSATLVGTLTDGYELDRVGGELEFVVTRCRARSRRR
jgi:hypothetical protein